MFFEYVLLFPEAYKHLKFLVSTPSKNLKNLRLLDAIFDLVFKERWLTSP
jgi:hypothetical protein